MQTVCLALQIEKKEVLNGTRIGEGVYARQLFHYTARKMKFGTTHAIGRFTGRNYSTVVNSTKRVNAWMEVDKDVVADVERIFDFYTEDPFKLLIEQRLLSYPKSMRMELFNYIDGFDEHRAMVRGLKVTSNEA